MLLYTMMRKTADILPMKGKPQIVSATDASVKKAY